MGSKILNTEKIMEESWGNESKRIYEAGVMEEVLTNYLYLHAEFNIWGLLPCLQRSRCSVHIGEKTIQVSKLNKS